MKAVFIAVCALMIYMVIGVFMVVVIKTSEYEDEYDETDFRLAILWPIVLVVLLYFILEKQMSLLINRLVLWILRVKCDRRKDEEE